MSRMLSQKQVASLLGVTARTVRAMEKRVKITRYSTGAGRGHKVLYAIEEVERWVSKLAVIGKAGKSGEKEGLTRQ